MPRALHKAELLCAFYTDVCADVGVVGFLDTFLLPGWRGGRLGRLLNRHVRIPPSLIEAFPGLVLLKSMGLMPSKSDGMVEYWLKQNSGFCRRVAETDFRGADAVYAFNGAALEVFEKARNVGLKTVLDQSSAPLLAERKLLEEEMAKWPDFDVGAEPSGAIEAFAGRERNEHGLSDLILCGSEFVRDSIQDGEEKKLPVQLLPYGICPAPASTEPRLRRHSREFHVLFAGTVHLMKGVQYLLEAARALKGHGFVFRLVGSVKVPDGVVKQLKAVAEVRGHVPRAEMRNQYNWADIVVHPTLSEGSSNVCFEALAEGLPVVTTRNAGSVVRDRVDGFIVPIRSSGALVERIGQLAGDIDLLSSMSRNALERASQFTPDAYARRLAQAIRHMRGGEQ